MIQINTKRFKYFLLAIGILLSIPLIAMQFTSEVNWGPGDFLVALVLLVTLGISVEIVLQKVKGINARRVWIILAVFVFLLVWAELAVGVFGTPFAGK